MYIVLYVCIYIWLNIYIWFLYICVFLVLQALFPQPRGWGDFKEACADFLRAKLWVTCSTLQKGTRLSASVEQIHTDCKEHPTCFWSRTTKGSGLGEGNVWERNESLLPAFALSLHRVYGAHRVTRCLRLPACTTVCSEIKPPSPEAARTTD